MAASNFDDGKDDPDFAARTLCLLLVAADFSGERRQKGRYLLKTLALAAGVAEVAFDAHWATAIRGEDD
jgi:hypothetical protein